MVNKKIYFDNACTTAVKPDNVKRVIREYLEDGITNINRSSYKKSNEIEEKIYETRERINKFFNGETEKNVIFTKNITESLNVVIKGFLREGEHVIVSGVEHNAVMRPLESLRNKNITYDIVKCDKYGQVEISDLKNKIKNNTKMIVMTVASNVNGTIIDIEKVGEVAKEKNLFFVVDTAQAAGIINIDMKKFNISCVTFTGHKSLYGPQGIGGFVINSDMESKMSPLIYGGTGSISDKLVMPSFLPDKYEAGTLNLIGILGLNEGIKFIEANGIENIYNHEMEITKIFIDGILNIDGKYKCSLIGKKNINDRVGVVSICSEIIDNGEFAYLLDEEYGVMVRAGLHCAPIAHKTFGTYDKGTVRFSFSFNTKEEEVRYAISGIEKILKSKL